MHYRCRLLPASDCRILAAPWHARMRCTSLLLTSLLFLCPPPKTEFDLPRDWVRCSTRFSSSLRRRSRKRPISLSCCSSSVRILSLSLGSLAKHGPPCSSDTELIVRRAGSSALSGPLFRGSAVFVFCQAPRGLASNTAADCPWGGALANQATPMPICKIERPMRMTALPSVRTQFLRPSLSL